MTTAVQHRRGTTAEHSTFTGLEGEVTIDTTKDTAVIHDGVLAGGVPLARENLANVTPSGLATITGASTASDDKFFIYDQSATTLKSITRAELNNAMEIDALANVTITGGTINGTTIGNTTAAAGTFTNLTASGTVTIPDNAISGDKVEGGTINAITINTLSANPTLSAGTANGVTYLNGSKVLTSGSALTYNGTSFGVGSSSYGDAGTISLSVGVAGSTTGGLQLFAGSAQEHYIQWGDATSGAGTYAGAISYSHASDFMRFWTSSTEQMRLTSTGLGIGTSSPTTQLSISQGGNGNNLNVKSRAHLGATYSSNSLVLGYSVKADTAAVDQMIGTETNSGGGAPAAILMNSGVIQFHTNSSITSGATFSSERLRLDSSGNLGLGVTPSAWATYTALQTGWSALAGYAAADTALFSNAYFDGGYKYIGNGFASQYRQINSAHQWFTAASGTAGDPISFTQAMTLDASGSLLVGSTSGTYRLSISVSSGADRDIFLAGVTGTSNGFHVRWINSTGKTHVIIADIPTSSAGLSAGTLWNDGGTLKIA